MQRHSFLKWPRIHGDIRYVSVCIGTYNVVHRKIACKALFWPLVF
jgi:hypothetical protein